MRIIICIFLFCLLTECIERHSNKNMKNVEHLEIGFSKSQVISKMGSEPNQILFDDFKFHNGKRIDSLTTFVYSTPTGASSEIYLYFEGENDSLAFIYYDL